MSLSAEPLSAVRLACFKRVLDTILDHMIDDLGIESVPIEPEKDFYWNVDNPIILHNENPALDVGKLTEDWELLSKILEDRERVAALMLVHAAPLLRYIGEKVGK